MKHAPVSAMAVIGLLPSCREAEDELPLVRAEWTSGGPLPDQRVLHWTLEVESNRTGRLDVDGTKSAVGITDAQVAELERLLVEQRFFDLPSPGMAVPCGGMRELDVRSGGRENEVRGPIFGTPEEQARFEAVWDLVASWVEPALSAEPAPR